MKKINKIIIGGIVFTVLSSGALIGGVSALSSKIDSGEYYSMIQEGMDRRERIEAYAKEHEAKTQELKEKQGQRHQEFQDKYSDISTDK